jgi:hypothetical protein
MLSFEPELHPLRPLLGDAATDTLLARERREVFSLQPELRIIAWGGAMLLATAAGIVLKNNLDRIGPLALALLMAIAAAACYVWVWWRRSRASLADDYVLLLGALLVSGDVAFIESQFHLLGANWYRHYLLLAVFHAAGAYLYRSRVLLTLSITAMAAWLGIERRPFGFFGPFDGKELALRAAAGCAVMLMGRALNRRAEFTPVFEHFAANFAFAATFALMSHGPSRIAGCLLAIALAAVVIAWGFRTRREAFVLYAFVYAVIAFDILLIDRLNAEAFIFLLLVISTIGAIAALFAIHSRFRELRA